MEAFSQFPSRSILRHSVGLAIVTIELKSRQHDIHARGKLNLDGTFTLTTYEEGDGAVEGKHDCVIVQFVMTEGVQGHRPSTIGVIDRRYNSYTTSGLVLN